MDFMARNNYGVVLFQSSQRAIITHDVRWCNWSKDDCDVGDSTVICK